MHCGDVGFHFPVVLCFTCWPCSPTHDYPRTKQISQRDIDIEISFFVSLDDGLNRSLPLFESKIMEAALLDTLKDIMRNEWSAALEAAWKQLYYKLSRVTCPPPLIQGLFL